MRSRFRMLAERDDEIAQQRARAIVDDRAKARREREPVAQRREIARPRRAQRDAREDALEIADAAQDLA